MPKLIGVNEKSSCFATIQLDNGDICFISVARTGVLVKTYRPGLWNALVGAFFGTVLYREKNVHHAASRALALSSTIPSTVLQIANPVLSTFTHAVWNCSSAAQAAVVLNHETE